jgi:hypothetical protein
MINTQDTTQSKASRVTYIYIYLFMLDHRGYGDGHGKNFTPRLGKLSDPLMPGGICHDVRIPCLLKTQLLGKEYSCEPSCHGNLTCYFSRGVGVGFRHHSLKTLLELTIN